jgi:hypothetical protein
MELPKFDLPKFQEPPHCNLSTLNLPESMHGNAHAPPISLS